MKIKELYLSGIKENNKVDFTIITDDNKERNFFNCELVGDNNPSDNNISLIMYYENYKED